MGSFLRRACLALTLIIELFIASVAAQTPAAGDLGQFPLPGNFCSRGEPMWVNGQIRCVGCGGAGEPCCSQSQPRCYGAQQDWACFAGPGAPSDQCNLTRKACFSCPAQGDIVIPQPHRRRAMGSDCDGVRGVRPPTAWTLHGTIGRGSN